MRQRKVHGDYQTHTLIANKITVRRGSSKTFLAPFPIIEITKIQNKARITTI